MVTFEAPWPAEYLEDQCALFGCMSTDEPHGDGDHQEEAWDAERVARERRALAPRVAPGSSSRWRSTSPSGRLVACTELLLAADAPEQAWQMLTVVHPEHRGHRLGLAVKLANLDAWPARLPPCASIVTGNAAVNGPMIAVNEMMGFGSRARDRSGRSD